jgi:hypothetical protein
MIKSGKALVTLLIILIFLLACSLGNNRTAQKGKIFISSDKFVTIENEPFFPIGIYSANPPSGFKEIKEAGFNTVHTYETRRNYLREYIDNAARSGLKVLIYPGGDLANAKFSMEEMVNTIMEFEKAPAILAWYLSDEPELQGANPEQIAKLIKSVRKMDPSRPGAMVVAQIDKYGDYSDATDIFMVDPYPVPRKPLIDVAKAVDLARKTVGDKKPVWAVLQAFGYQNEKNKGWGWQREPTYLEMRAMTYLAIVQGAKGIFYYTYHGSQYFIKESPRHWENLKAVVKELRAIYPLLISPEINSIERSIMLEGSSQSSLFWTVRNVSGGSAPIQEGTYLIVVNGANEPVMANIRIKQHSGTDIHVVFENRKLVFSDRQFSDLFAPYEVHIYQFK